MNGINITTYISAAKYHFHKSGQKLSENNIYTPISNTNVKTKSVLTTIHKIVCPLTKFCQRLKKRIVLNMVLGDFQLMIFLVTQHCLRTGHQEAKILWFSQVLLLLSNFYLLPQASTIYLGIFYFLFLRQKNRKKSIPYLLTQIKRVF